LDEAEARLGLVAHKLLDDLGRGRLVGFDVKAVQISAPPVISTRKSVRLSGAIVVSLS